MMQKLNKGQRKKEKKKSGREREKDKKTDGRLVFVENYSFKSRQRFHF
jgi:hypothetical protein